MEEKKSSVSRTRRTFERGKASDLSSIYDATKKLSGKRSKRYVPQHDTTRPIERIRSRPLTWHFDSIRTSFTKRERERHTHILKKSLKQTELIVTRTMQLISSVIHLLETQTRPYPIKIESPNECRHQFRVYTVLKTNKRPLIFSTLHSRNLNRFLIVDAAECCNMVSSSVFAHKSMASVRPGP